MEAERDPHLNEGPHQWSFPDIWKEAPCVYVHQIKCQVRPTKHHQIIPNAEEQEAKVFEFHCNEPKQRKACGMVSFFRSNQETNLL